MTNQFTRQELDSAALNQLLRGRNGGVVRNMLRRALRIETLARRKVKVDNGRLRTSITHRVIERGGATGFEIGTDVEYALAVHEGTGIYGPRGTPIVPQHSKYLVFVAKDGTKVYARQVKGQEPNPFLRDALNFGARGH